MPSFPLVSPESYGVANLRWSAVSNDSYARNPWTMDLIKQIWDGRMWRGTLTMTAQGEESGRELTGWLVALRRAGTNAGEFLLGNPAAKVPLGSAKDTPGTPVVSGAAQTGEALDVSGLPLSATAYLKIGDFVQLGTGVTSRLKMVIDQVDSDGSGLATMKLWPPIRIAPSNGAAVVVTSAQGLFVEPSAVSSWSVRPPVEHDGFVIEVAEVVP